MSIDNLDNTIIAYSIQHSEKSIVFSAISDEPLARPQGWEGAVQISDKNLHFKKVVVSNSSVWYLFKLTDSSKRTIDVEALLVSITDVFVDDVLFDFDIVSHKYSAG